jgi:hypothetical protein
MVTKTVLFFWGEGVDPEGKNLLWSEVGIDEPHIGSEVALPSIAGVHKVKNVVYNYRNVDSKKQMTVLVFI